MKAIKSIPKKDRLLTGFLMLSILILLISISLYFLNIEKFEAEQYDVLSFCESIPEPVFSVPEGIYEQPFELEIYAPADYSIYYTTDGSTPTTRSFRYKKRLYVDPKKNLNKNILYIPTSLIWRPPFGKQNHCTVLRARCFKNGVGYGPVKNMIYSSPDITRHQGFNVIHLLIEPDSLFSPKKGIYVVGEKFYSKKAYATLDRMPDDFKHWLEPPANYYERGNRWRRPAVFILMDLSGKTLFEQNVITNVRGNVSRTMPGKALEIRADNLKDTVLAYPFFNELSDSLYKRLLLRNGGFDFRVTMFRDDLMHRLANNATKLDVQASEPSVLYINGNYWGIYNMREKLDEHYLAGKYATSLQNISIINNRVYDSKQFTLYYGDESSLESFNELLSFIKENSLANHEAYHAVCSQIDVDNFIDYMILETFFANWDWPYNNVRLYRFAHQTEFMKQHGIDAGKWRCFFLDLDGGMDIDMYTSINMFDWLRDKLVLDAVTQIFFGLMENDDFKEKFIARYEYLIKNHLSSEKMIEQINLFEAIYQQEMKRQIARWRNLRFIQSWQYYVETLRIFARERPAFVLEQLKDM